MILQRDTQVSKYLNVLSNRTKSVTTLPPLQLPKQCLGIFLIGDPEKSDQLEHEHIAQKKRTAFAHYHNSYNQDRGNDLGHLGVHCISKTTVSPHFTDLIGSTVGS